MIHQFVKISLNFYVYIWPLRLENNGCTLLFDFTIWWNRLQKRFVESNSFTEFTKFKDLHCFIPSICKFYIKEYCKALAQLLQNEDRIRIKSDSVLISYKLQMLAIVCQNLTQILNKSKQANICLVKKIYHK